MVDAMRPEDDVAAACGVLEVEPVLPQDEVAAQGVVDDEPCNKPRDVPRNPDARRRRSSRRRAARRATRRVEAPGRTA
jgi:hypothetical protein